ncbi:hypothetical protein AVEN_164750-1 [Araneus ventricosus]|uniref:Uncharacterized protein n=1 Tax=Araneus ventricosus TaxID=182803 RepID=A0A4Y2NXN7_ARAVE|nr:hypothetical protein AVEN_164750-1 [Araneus ventricosus]
MLSLERDVRRVTWQRRKVCHSHALFSVKREANDFGFRKAKAVANDLAVVKVGSTACGFGDCPQYVFRYIAALSIDVQDQILPGIYCCCPCLGLP